MKKVLITGANKSIGFETARQLLQKGYFIYLGARDLDKGNEAIAKLKAEGLTNVQPIQIEVTDPASIAAARKQVDSLDILINNAGILGSVPQNPTGTATGVIREVFDTNFFGAIDVTNAFIDLLKQSDEPRIVNVTSGLGSLTMQSDRSWRNSQVRAAAYVPSKAALNAYTVVLAYELYDTAFKVNVVDPGYTATDFNNHSGPGTVEEAAARLVKCAIIAADGPTGQFFSDDNNEETGISPW